MSLYVLVGGWPASGETTLASALTREMQISLLSKDAVKESLMDALGAPSLAEASRRLGVAAVHAVLRAARTAPGAVIDSTWFSYTKPLVKQLDGSIVEVRCHVPIEVARARFQSRARDPRHLDRIRSPEELWRSPVAPLGVCPLVDVDTQQPVDVEGLAHQVRALTFPRAVLPGSRGAQAANQPISTAHNRLDSIRPDHLSCESCPWLEL